MYLIDRVLILILPFLYLMLLYGYSQIFFGHAPRYEHKTRVLFSLVLLIHAFELLLRQVYLKAMPLSSIFDALSFLAFSILLVYFLIERIYKNQASGFFILIFAFFPILIASFNPAWQQESNPLLANPLLAIHASLNIMGYTALVIGAVYALLYLIQFQNIKQRRFTRIFDQLPPLVYLGKMSKGAVLLGIIIMGLGLTLGHLQTKKIFGQFFLPDIKVILTDTIWLFYVAAYSIAHLKKWSTRLLAYLSVGGFLFLLAVLIGVGFGKSFHTFY